MKYTSSITETWNNLHQLLEKNLSSFDTWSPLNEIKQIANQGKEYLIIKINLWHYVIIDLETNQTILKKDVKKNFNEEFFINNFGKRRTIANKDCLDMYNFFNYNSPPQEIIAFYQDNQELLSLPHKLFYKIRIDQAWTYLSINLANGKIQLGFETKDQFLYEHLFMNKDLTPFALQDATAKLGIDKMTEIFNRIKSIKIPFALIPQELYQHSLLPNSNPPHKKQLILTP